MNILQLEYFVAVAEEGSMQRAAEKLHVSPSAVSQIIRKLEEELDVRLFERGGQSLALTYAGRRFASYARSVLVGRSNFIREVRDQSGEIRGELTLFLSEYKATVYLPLLMPPFLQKYPGAKLNIVDQHLTPELRKKNLLEGIYDFTLSPTSIHDRNIRHIAVCREHLCVIVRKDSPAAERLFPDGKIPAVIRPECLREEPLVLTKRGYSGRNCTDGIFRERNLHPRIVAELNSSTALWELAATGIGCGVVHRYIVPGATGWDSSPVYEIPIDHPAASREIYLAYDQNRYLSALHKAFISNALEVFRESHCL